MKNTESRGKGLKLMIKLHQPKKWEKPKYISDREYDYVESLIYNDQNIRFKEYMQEREQEISATWIESFLVEDEAYAQCITDENYFFTTFGRIFSSKRTKQLALVQIGSKLQVGIGNKAIDLGTEFNEQGWIFSRSFIIEKYEQYGWNYKTNYKLK